MDVPPAPHPSRRLWVALLALSALGLAVAIKLALVHVHAHLDPGARSFCAISESVNCDTVARSGYSVFLQVPVAAWGIYGYLVMLGVAFWGWRAPKELGSAAIMLAFGGFSVAVSLVLAVISAFYISSLCILCLTTYLINVLLFALAWWVVRGQEWRRTFGAAWDYLAERGGTLGMMAALLVLLAVGLVAGYPRYWESPARAGGSAKETLRRPGDGVTGRVPLATGVTEEGHFWIGAREPAMTIMEFSDYQCPFCNQAHAEVRALLEKNPILRLVHRHFPLDPACNPMITEPLHPFACAYSALAACAGEQGKFWSANDYLFEHGRATHPVQPDVFARDLGLDFGRLGQCLEKRAWSMVRPDVDEGIGLKLTGTPTFQIDDQLYLGKLPPEILEKIRSSTGAPSSKGSSGAAAR